jgi:hypothetical protein
MRGDPNDSAWVYRTSGNVVLAKGHGDVPTQVAQTEYILHVNGNGFYYRGAWRSSSALTIPTAEWTHIVVTAQGNVLTFYRNGSLINSIWISGSYASTQTHPFYLGKQGSGSAATFTGRVDDVRIYRRTLGPWEIQALANKSVYDTDVDGIPDYLEDANGDGLWTPGETDWTNRDTDGDGLPDGWEIAHGLSPFIADGLHGASGDPDADGFTNQQEYLMGTSPVRPNGMNFGGTYKSVTLASASAPKTYDVYYRAPGGTKWRRISSGVPGQNAFNVVNPNQSAEGDFIFLDAKDTDGDGLSNGYENWFTYNGQLTDPLEKDTNGDEMRDGWKIAYGLDPLVDQAGEKIPSHDPLTTLQKHNAYYGASAGFDASFDAFKHSNSSDVRPVITISQSSPIAFNTTSFTITRDVGSAINIQNAPALVVYYAVGGTLAYGIDFILDPAPLQAHFPDVFSIEIPQGQATVALTAILIRDSMPVGDQSLTVTLTPYGSIE